MIDDPYESPFFTRGDPQSAHALAEVLKYSRETACIEPRWCWQPLDTYLSAAEAHRVRAVRKLIKSGVRGFCYWSPFDIAGDLSVGERMNLIAGTCVRNHLDARVRLVGDLLDRDTSEKTRDAQILLIPDFCLGATAHQAYEIQKLRSLILDRASRERYTVLFVTNLKELAAAFGPVVATHVETKLQGDPR